MINDPKWLTDKRIRDIKHGDDATPAEVLALAGEVRERRRTLAEDPRLTDKERALTCQ
jgi:hypothetical protein